MCLHKTHPEITMPMRRTNSAAASVLFARRSVLFSGVFSVLLCAALARAQAPSTLDQARQAMEAKQYWQAEAIYRQALQQEPKSAALLTDLGLSLQMQARSAEAMHAYSLALKQRYVPETYALLAEERCRMGQLEELRPMLARLYREDRNNLRVMTAIAPCYLDVNEPVESAIIYRSLVDNQDYPADLARIQLAKSYIRSGQSFAEKLSKAPNGEPFLAALRQAPVNGSAGARSAFARAASMSPYFKAELDWMAAVHVWQQHPNDAALLYLLAVLSAEEGMRQVQLCESRFPDSPYVAQFYADVLADQGRADEAIAQYEQLIRQHPDLSDLYYSLGLMREKREEWPQAAAAFQQQLAAYPADERAAAHLSRCYLQMEQYTTARDFLESRMKGGDPPQWASLNLAEAEQKLGDSNTAIRILVAAEREPDVDKLVHYRLMHLYTLSGRPADARREFALFQAANKK